MVKDQGDLPHIRKELLATHVSASGATVYMNKCALQTLIAELNRISDANPADCFEVHIGRLFSYFLDNDNFKSPPVVYHDDLKNIFADKVANALAEEIKTGSLPNDALASPFEVTIMHVSDEALLKDETLLDEDRVPTRSFWLDC